MIQIIGALQRQAEQAGYSREWRRTRAFVFHLCSQGGGLIWPGQLCEYRWDGSGYDPENIWRKIP